MFSHFRRKLQSSCSYPHRCNPQSLCMTWDVHRAIKAGRVVDLVTSNFQLGDGPSHFGPNDTTFLSKHRTPPTVSFPFPSQKLNYSSLRRIMVIKLCRSEKRLKPREKLFLLCPLPTQHRNDGMCHHTHHLCIRCLCLICTPSVSQPLIELISKWWLSIFMCVTHP